MRLLHVADYGGPQAGSFVPMLAALAAAGGGRGWSVEAVLPTRARGRPWLGELERAGVPVRFLDAKPAVAAARTLRALLDDGRPTIVHTHFTAFDVAALLATRGSGARLIWHVHTSPPNGRRAHLRSGLKHRLLGRRVAATLCVAEHIADELRRRGARRARFLPNGIPVERFGPVERGERARARARLGVPDEVPLALHFGRDWEVKGGDLFLGAVARLRADGRPVHALVLRGGQAQRALAAQLGIEDAVHGIDGVEDIRDLYVAADLFASTSRHEGMPFTVLESLACGVPVVATAIPGHLAIASRCPGLELAPVEPRGIAGAIATVLDRDPDEQAAQLAEARRWIDTNATLESWAAAILRVYDEVAPPGYGAPAPAPSSASSASQRADTSPSE